MSETGESTPAPAGRPGHVRWRRLLVYGMAAAAVAAFAGHRFGGRGEAVLAGAAVLGLVIWRLPHLRKHLHNPYRRGPGSLNYPGQAGRGLIRPSRPRAGSGLPRLTRSRRSSSLPSPSGRRRGGAGLIPGRSRRLSRPGGASPARSGARRGGMLRTRRHAGATPRARRGRSPGTGRGGAGSARAGRRAARRVSAGLLRSGRAGSRGLLNRRGTAGTGRRPGTARRAGASRSPLPSRWHPVARRRGAAGTGRRRGAAGTGRRPGTARRAGAGRSPLPSRWHPVARRRAITARRRPGAGRSPLPSRWHPVARHRAAVARRRASTRRGAPARPGRLARIWSGAWRAARSPAAGWRRVTGSPGDPRGLRRAAHRAFGTPPQRQANRAARKMRRTRHRARVRAARVRAAAGAYGHPGHGWMSWRRLTRRSPRTHAATGRALTRRQRLARWRDLRRGRHAGLGLGAGQFLGRLRNRPPRPLLAGGSPAMARFRRSALGRVLAGLDRRRRDRWMRRHRRHAPAPVRRPGMPVPAVPGWGARPARTFTNRSRTGRGHPVADVHAAADELRGMVQDWFDANDLDQTLEDLHYFPRAMQESFSALAEQLRENTNLADRIPEAVAQAASDMTGVAERLHEAIEYGVQRS